MRLNQGLLPAHGKLLRKLILLTALFLWRRPRRRPLNSMLEHFSGLWHEVFGMGRGFSWRLIVRNPLDSHSKLGEATRPLAQPVLTDWWRFEGNISFQICTHIRKINTTEKKVNNTSLYRNWIFLGRIAQELLDILKNFSKFVAFIFWLILMYLLW